MLKIRYSSRFKKDFKAIIKRGFDIKLFEKSLDLLINEKPLSEKLMDHSLSGE
jgi:mRNA interferase YafQ